MLTKAQYRTMVRQYLDDPNGKRWGDVSLDLAIQLVLDDLWTDMLDQAPYLTSQLQTISTLVSPGYIDLRLIINGGQLAQRFYRIQSIKSAERIYYPKDPRDYLTTAGENAVLVGSAYTYEIKGDFVWLYSNSSSFGSAPVDIRYSFKPVAFTGLADGNNVPFPEGSEMALVLSAAANTMAKGNTEDAVQLMALAEKARQRLLDAIRRQWHGSMQPYTTGTSTEFGST